MKPDTRNGYIKRYDDCIKQIVRAMQGEDVSGADMEKWKELFHAGKEIEGIVYEGTVTTVVSNKLQSFEGRVANALGGSFDLPKGGMDEVEVEEGSAIDMLMQAQALLTGAYGKIVTENSLAAHVPAVMAIKAKADDMKGVISDVMRISASLS